MDMKYHNSSNDACFANLGISKNDDASYLFDIGGCSVSFSVDSLNRLISVIICVISWHHVVLNNEIQPK